jgi:hypothetical protein
MPSVSSIHRFAWSHRLVLLGLSLATAPLSGQESVDTRMAAWSAALGVECTHCHVADRWAETSKPTFDFAARMRRMVAALNAGPLSGTGAVTCWTCHRGRPTPARLPRDSWEKIRTEHASEFANAPNRGITMSVYAASLGVDCSHCHEADRALDSKAAKAMVPTMLAIFDEIPKHFDKAVRTPSTQCYMCHQGQVKPEP